MVKDSTGVKVVISYPGQVACHIEEIRTGPWFDHWPRLREPDGATRRVSRNSGQGANLRPALFLNMHKLYDEKTRLLSRSNWQEV